MFVGGAAHVSQKVEALWSAIGDARPIKDQWFRVLGAGGWGGAWVSEWPDAAAAAAAQCKYFTLRPKLFFFFFFAGTKTKSEA